jgi:hypothetical protein
MQRPSWRSPVRRWSIAVLTPCGLVAAVMGVWWTAVGMALFVAAQLASIAHERREPVSQ